MRPVNDLFMLPRPLWRPRAAAIARPRPIMDREAGMDAISGGLSAQDEAKLPAVGLAAAERRLTWPVAVATIGVLSLLGWTAILGMIAALAG